MFNQVTYNVLVDRLKAFADGHLLINNFTHGSLAKMVEQLDESSYPLMHVTPSLVSYNVGERSFQMDIVFADLPRMIDDREEYEREVISDMIQIGEDLIAEIRNGGVIFGQDVTLDDGVQFSPFIADYTHTISGISLSITLTFPYNWNACDIPANWTTGGSSSGSPSQGYGLLLKTNGEPNAVQSILDLINGSSTTIEDLGDGRVRINSAGGIGQLLALQWDINHTTATGNPYQVGDAVWYNGNVYRCIASNDSILPTNTLYWTLVGIGYRLRQQPANWNATDGDNQILNKPTIPTSLADWYTGVNKGDLIAYDGSQWEVRGNLNLNDIQDVSTNNAGNGQVLTFQNNEWIPTTPSFTQVNSDWNAISGVEEILNKPAIPDELRDLTDCFYSSPQQNDVLLFDTLSNQFTNEQLGPTAYSNDYNDLSNLPSIPPVIGDMTKAVYDTDADGIVDSAERIEIIVRNSTGSTLTKGQVVYLSGATGNRPNAILADASSEITSSKTIGLVIANIANNSDGRIAVNGTLHDLDTSSFTAGDTLWLSETAGSYQANTPPSEPAHAVFIGYVARSHPNLGRIVLAIQNGYELNELHGVDVPSPNPNDYLYYDSGTSLWKSRQLLASHITDSTDVGRELVTLPNPSAISYIRINANNTIDTRTPAQVLTDLGIASTIILARDNSAYSLTGVSVQTLVWSVAIPPNTLQANDFIEWFSLFNTTATNLQTIQYRIYVNTSASLTGALILGLYSNGVGTGNTNFQRNIYVTASGVSGNLRVLNTGSNSTSSYGISGLSATNQPIDTTTTLYFLIAFQPNNTAITTSVQSTLIRITR